MMELYKNLYDIDSLQYYTHILIVNYTDKFSVAVTVHFKGMCSDKFLWCKFCTCRLSWLERFYN